MTSSILVPGAWLGAWAWDEVSDALCDLGARVSALTLPGLESTQEDRSSITLADHVEAIRRAVEAADEPVILVLHSAGVVPGTAVADLVPERIAALVYVDAGPFGGPINPDLPGVEWPLPSWQELGAQGTSPAGLSHEQLETFRRRAVPEPAGAVREASGVPTHPERLDIPTTVVCCSMSSEQLVEAVAAELPFAKELAALHDVSYLDLPTGHWPMFSRPQDLARIIADIAESLPG